jgi:hypothetical protein
MTIRVVHSRQLPQEQLLRAWFGAFALVEGATPWRLDVPAGRLTPEAFCEHVGWFIDDEWGVSTQWFEFAGALWQANLDLALDIGLDGDQAADIGWELWQRGTGLQAAGEADDMDDAIVEVVDALNRLGEAMSNR